MAALLAYSLYERQQHELAEGVNNARHFAEIAAADSYRIINDAREMLQALAFRSTGQNADQHKCDPVFNGMSKVLPRLANIVTLDKNGMLLCSVLDLPAPAQQAISFANLDAFVELKKSNQLYLSGPQRGALSRKMVAVLAAPLKNAAAQFNGAIALSLDLARFPLLPDGASLPAGMTLAMIARNGVVVAHSQHSQEQIGMPFSDLNAVVMPDQGMQGARSLGAAGEASAATRVVSVVAVGDTGWRVVATQSASGWLAEQRQQVMLQGFLSLFIAMSGVLLAIFFARRITGPLQLASQTANRIAAGDLTCRIAVAGPKELVETIQQFNRMLDAREQDELALQHSEERFRTLVEWSPEAIVVHKAGIIIYANPAAALMFGAASAQELVGRSIISLVHPDFHPIVTERLKLLTEYDLNTSLLEQKLLRLDGVSIDAEVQSTSILYDNEQAIHTSFRNITERKRAEAALTDSEQRWKFAVEGSGDGLWDCDIAANSLFFSQRSKEILGFTEDEIGNTLAEWKERVHPDDRAQAIGAVQQYLNGTAAYYKNEHRVLDKDGHLKWILTRGRVVTRDAAGNASRMIGTYSDVTERVQEDLRLRAAFTKIRNLELALDEHAIVDITDALGMITYVNDKFCAVSQYHRDELIGQNHRLINSVHHSKAFIRELWRTISQGQVWKGEIKNLAKDGSYYWVDTTLVPFLDAGGKARQYFAIRRDITEQKKLELTLRHAAEQLRELSAHQMSLKENERKRIAREIHDDLGGLLHGIKSYLSVVIGRASRAGAPEDQVLSEASAMADQAIDTVRRMITELRPSVLDQLGLWAGLEWYTGQIAQRTELLCSCVIDENLVDLELDGMVSTGAFRIVQELTTNVIRHAEASKVEIRASREPAWIRIEVEDDGKGIDSSQILGEKSWGIIGMYERAQQCHGELKIINASVHGTLAVLRLPLEPLEISEVFEEPETPNA